MALNGAEHDEDATEDRRWAKVALGALREQAAVNHLPQRRQVHEPDLRQRKTLPPAEILPWGRGVDQSRIIRRS
jgi:hypothetical protein